MLQNEIVLLQYIRRADGLFVCLFACLFVCLLACLCGGIPFNDAVINSQLYTC